MKNKHFFYISILITLLTQSCNYDDTLYIEIDEKKLVVNAILVANEFPQVYVGRTFSPSGKISSNHFINNANVILLENGKIVGTLIHLKNGIYQLQKYILKSGNSYSFEVKVKDYQDAYNVPVLVPENVESNNVTFDTKTVYPSTGNSSGASGSEIDDANKARLLSVKLSDLIKEKYYGVGIKKSKGGSMVSGNTYPIEIGNIDFQKLNTDCYKFLALIENFDYDLLQKPENSLILYNASCFGKEKMMGLIVETYGTVQTPDKDGRYYNSTIDRLEATIVTLSEEYFNYAKNVKVIEGIDNAFFEPQRVYTNVVNGYGVVVAINKKVVVFNL